MEAAWQKEAGEVLSSLKMYDKNDDGEIDADEKRGLWFTVGTQR